MLVYGIGANPASREIWVATVFVAVIKFLKANKSSIIRSADHRRHRTACIIFHLSLRTSVREISWEALTLSGFLHTELIIFTRYFLCSYIMPGLFFSVPFMNHQNINKTFRYNIAEESAGNKLLKVRRTSAIKRINTPT